MTTLFRLDASIRQEGSVTRAVADTLQRAIDEDLTIDRVIARDVGVEPVDAELWATAAFAGFTPADGRSREQRGAIEKAAELADELTEADVLLFAVPMYNFGVSQHFKTWFDLVATDPRFTPGARTIVDRPAFLITARGGGYGPGTPREGWDHATSWMRRMLQELWGLDLEVIETELTLADVTPAMAQLRDLAREQLIQSHDAARRGARSVSRRLVGAGQGTR